MRRAIIGAIAALLMTVTAHAQSFSPDELAARNIQRRAVEAMIWAMPAVNTDLMLQTMLEDDQGEANEIVYWSKPVNWKNQTLTPNPDAIYLMSFWNVKDGPIVIEFRRRKAARSPATSSRHGRCRWRMPALKAPTRAKAANI